MKFVGLVSGGKDSLHCMVHAVALGHTPVPAPTSSPMHQPTCAWLHSRYKTIANRSAFSVAHSAVAACVWSIGVSLWSCTRLLPRCEVEIKYGISQSHIKYRHQKYKIIDNVFPRENLPVVSLSLTPASMVPSCGVRLRWPISNRLRWTRWIATCTRRSVMKPWSGLRRWVVVLGRC